MADVLRDSLFGLPQQGGAYIRNQVTGELFPSIGQQPGLWPFLSLGGPGTYIDLISNSQLHSAMQFTRASGGMTELSPGVLTTAAVNEPRYGWFNGRRGLLIEPAATNLVRNSNTFSAATWDKGVNSPVQSPTPDGTQFVSSSNSFSYVSTSVTVTPGVPVTLSWRIRRIGTIGVRVGSGIANDGSGGAAAFAAANALISKITTEWRVISCTVTPATSIITLHAVPYDAQGTTYEVSWVQAEQAGVNTSPILTGGSPATRAPDISAIATAAFGFNPSEGTFVCEYLAYAPMGNGILAAALLNLPGNSSDRMTLFGGAGGNVLFEGVQGGVSQFGIGAGLSAANVIQKVSCSYAENYFAASSNGLAPNTDMSGAVTSPVSTLAIGTAFTPGQMNGLIFSLRYYPRKSTETELKVAAS